MTPQFLRPRDAARRFGVSKSTLARWAKDFLIGRSKVGRCTYYRADDIAYVIARNEQPRDEVPAPVTEQRADTAAAHAFFTGGRR